MKQTVEMQDAPTPSFELVQPSLQLVIKHFDQIIFLFLLPLALFSLGSILVGDTSHMKHVADVTPRQKAGFAVIALGALWSLANMAPSLYFRLQAAKGQVKKLSEAYRQGIGYFWKLLGLYIFFALLVIIGLLLFVLPAFIAAYMIISRYYLAPYYLVDRNLTIRQALTTCHLETRTFQMSIWGIVGVQMLFAIAGALLAGTLRPYGAIASLFTGIVCLFLPALRYKEVSALYQSSQPSVKM